MLQQLVDILHRENCSLVVCHCGEVTTYSQKGVRDLIWLLDHEPWQLSGALVADKVVGKASAALMALGGVKEVYAEVLSRRALPLLDDACLAYSYGELVDQIVIPEGDTRCPLEQIVAEDTTPSEVENSLRRHFAEMQQKKTLKQT